MIAAAGSYAGVSPQAPSAVVTDHRPHLLMAGFIDTHLHFPQAQVVASWGSQLLDWLNGYVFPEEARFVDPEHSAAKDYLHIYETYGLLSDKMLLGHCIHLSDREVASMAETGAHPVFCPTSNLFLGSGGFNDQRLREAGVANAIATDIGAGTSYSMLQTLNEGYKILQLQDRKLHALRAFDWITRGNASVLGLADRIGTLDAGTEADIVVLDARATPAMELRMERAETLDEELFVLQIMGDDRSVAQTYIAGVPQK